MTDEAKCEHCGTWMQGVFVKTSVYRTWRPNEGEYLNTEQNWDYEGTIFATCPQCGKETESVTFTDDGRLIPTPPKQTTH